MLPVKGYFFYSPVSFFIKSTSNSQKLTLLGGKFFLANGAAI